MNTRKIDIPATFACLGALVFWSFGAVFVRLLAAYMDVWTQNALRYLVASLFWLPFLYIAIRKNRLDGTIWRRSVLPAAVNVIWQIFWAGGLYYINPAFMYLLTQSSIVWIAGLSFIFFPSERGLVKSRYFWIGMVLSAAGVIGVTFYRKDFAVTGTATGIIIALAGAFIWAAYSISVRIAFKKDIGSRDGFSVISIYTTFGLTVLALKFGRLQDCVRFETKIWLYIIISGITAIALAHVLYYAAMKRIGATITSLILLATPFTALAVSHFVLGESLNIFQIVFGLVLLAGAGLAIFAQQHLRNG